VRPPPQAPVPQRFFSFLASVFCRDNFGVAPIWHRLGVSWKEHHSRHLPTSSYFVLRPESERMLRQWPRGTTHVHDKAAKVEVAATVKLRKIQPTAMAGVMVANVMAHRCLK